MLYLNTWDITATCVCEQLQVAEKKEVEKRYNIIQSMIIQPRIFFRVPVIQKNLKHFHLNDLHFQ